MTNCSRAAQPSTVAKKWTHCVRWGCSVAASTEPSDKKSTRVASKMTAAMPNLFWAGCKYPTEERLRKDYTDLVLSYMQIAYVTQRWPLLCRRLIEIHGRVSWRLPAANGLLVCNKIETNLDRSVVARIHSSYGTSSGSGGGTGYSQLKCRWPIRQHR